MKIVLLTGWLGSGGGERVISVLANELCRQGHDVRVLVLSQDRTVWYPLDTRIRTFWLCDRSNAINTPSPSWSYRIKKKLCFGDEQKISFLRGKRDYLNESDRIVSFLDDEPADLLLSNLVHSNLSAALCSKRTAAKTIIIEGTYPFRKDYQPYFIKLRNYAYKHADICVFQTEDQKMLFPTSIQKKGIVIGNPLNSDLPEPFIGQRKKVIVNFCRFSAPKNLPLLIDAFSDLSKEYPDYELHLYGSGELEAELQEYIENIYLSEKVKMFPFRSDVHEVIKDAAMFVTTSDFEGLSNSLLEAMAIGLPVIATDCLGGGAKTLIRNKENGLLVPRGDREAIYSAMKQYVEYSDLAEQYGIEAQKVRTEYSVKKIVAELLDVLQ